MHDNSDSNLKKYILKKRVIKICKLEYPWQIILIGQKELILPHCFSMRFPFLFIFYHVYYHELFFWPHSCVCISSLRERTQVEQLICYIVEEAPEDAEKKRIFKYVLACEACYLRPSVLLNFLGFYSMVSCRFPFIACEIFTCEIDIILRTLVEDEEVWLYIYDLVLYISVESYC